MTLSEISPKEQRVADFEQLAATLAKVQEIRPCKWWGPGEYANWHLAQQCLQELRDRNDPNKEQLT